MKQIQRSVPWNSFTFQIRNSAYLNNSLWRLLQHSNWKYAYHLIEKLHPMHKIVSPWMVDLYHTDADGCISKAKDIGANAFNYYAGQSKRHLKKCTDGDLELIVDNTWGAGYIIYTDMFSWPWEP